MVNPKNPRTVDQVDRRLIALLGEHGRMSYHALAAELHVAESTAHARVAHLVESKIISGFHADVDLVRLGLGIEALVHVRLRERSRALLHDEEERLARVPGVIEVFFLAGQHDIIVRVACATSADLRDFILNELNRHPEVAATETSVILEHVRGTRTLESPLG